MIGQTNFATARVHYRVAQVAREVRIPSTLINARFCTIFGGLCWQYLRLAGPLVNRQR
jgi:hypothetical protein